MGKKEVAPPRVVIDTNVLVSALLFGGQPGKLRDWWVGGRLVPLVSKETFAEFGKVLAYPKFRLSPAEIAMIVEEELLPYAEVVDVAEDAAGVCRDSHDDKFLALAAAGKASYLVTGDRDLLALQTFGNTQIVTVRDILGLL
jgi:putative PIN family toxin of toxin-antitoxin system